MRRRHVVQVGGLLALALSLVSAGAGKAQENDPAAADRRPIQPPHISSDPSVRYDYDLVYVRAPRYGDERRPGWAEFSDPTRMERGADLMLLRPDGSEELLVSGQDGSVMDPYVSFDGKWVYYAKFTDSKHRGADIFKIHVPTRQIVRLTDQTFTPNTGAAPWSRDLHTPEEGKTALRYGVYNLGPCPVPGGRVMFTSNRNAYCPPRGYPRITLQLFLMDDDGRNVEQVGFLNVACALHPVILRDGRVLFSTLESQGMHNSILWGIWSIYPDGRYWEPVMSAFATGGAPSGFHFQTQLSDGSIVIEHYYNLNNSGFGTYFKLPERPPAGEPPFGPADLNDPRNAPLQLLGRRFQQPFMPNGIEALTPFTHGDDGPAPTLIKGEQVRARVHGGTEYPHAVGKVTHPCGAPDNHLLTVWTPGPANHQYNYYPLIDAGIYLIKDGGPAEVPSQMLLIKNDPRYNEQWPRPLVSYRRIYGVDEPQQLPFENDGRASPHLPEGTPFGLVGTSSLYKRESAPGGVVAPGSVTAVTPDVKPDSWSWSSWRLNWALQGSDAGRYDNDEIHAIRIIAQEPRSDVRGNGTGGSPFYANHAMERMRILGEIPVRKFLKDGTQPVDPDGNPDTSFLARIPADQSFTFQLIDRNGMNLTMAQTWHQVRPGEIRNDCGGCHAHSQKPTRFEETFAARKDYQVFDLTRQTPLLTSRDRDESGRQWDADNETGVRLEQGGVVNVEYFRDIQPILARSCTACHTKRAEKPAGGLVLDDDDDPERIRAFGHDAGPDVAVPKAYFRLAGYARFQPRTGIFHDSATRYVQKFQARRSLLAWKIYGRRLDGWTNDDFPSLTVAGDPRSLRWKGEKIPNLDYSDEEHLRRWIRDRAVDLDYVGSPMPPPEAVKGQAIGPLGEPVKVAPLSDDDRRTIVRWIDLGCPIDVDPQYDPNNPDVRSFGWMGDDQRPTLAVRSPAAGAIGPLTEIVIGMYDAYSGLDLDSFRVTADFPIDGIAPGTNLAEQFEVADHVWRWQLNRPIERLENGLLQVQIKDRQGNINRIQRSFWIEPKLAGD